MATFFSVNNEAWWSSRVYVKWLWCVFPPSGASDFAEPASGMSLPPPALSWVWLVDLERTVALLVGRCLGGMLQGAPTSLEEQDTAYWLKTPLFSNGLEMETPQLGRRRSQAGGPSGRAALCRVSRGSRLLLQTPASAVCWRRRCLVTRSRSPWSARCSRT